MGTPGAAGIGRNIDVAEESKSNLPTIDHDHRWLFICRCLAVQANASRGKRGPNLLNTRTHLVGEAHSAEVLEAAVCHFPT